MNKLFNYRRILSTVLLGSLAITGTVAAEENWPAWRGPLANGVAPTAKPPLSWSETSNVKWKVKIPGLASASPVVWENKVFIQTAIPSNEGSASPTEKHRWVIQCYDRASGKMLWEKVAREESPHEGHHPADGTFASGSALTDGKNVYAYFGSRGIYCYDMDGNLKWSKDLGQMKVFMGFGEGSSPALYGDMIVVNWDHEAGSFITALNKNTGAEIWKTPRDEKTAWATPLVVEYQGQAQVVTVATGKIRTYELATGKLLWECKGLTRNVIPTPVAGNGIVYCTSGFQGNALLAIKLGGSGDLTGSDSIVWKYGKNTPYVPSPLLTDNKIYCFSSNSPSLSCFDAATGKVLIDGQRIAGLDSVYASPVVADGRIYIVGRNGTTVVIKASDKLEILSTNKLDDKIDASPAVVGGDVFLKGKQFLYCMGEK